MKYSYHYITYVISALLLTAFGFLWLNLTDLLFVSGSSQIEILYPPDFSTTFLNHESSRIADCSAVVTDS